MSSELEEKVLDWYSTIRPVTVDIVGDYAGSSRFLIHGDSLLRHCLSDDRIDFLSGYPILHAVYVVERFLFGMVKRKCVFDIAFFDLDKRICIPPGRQVKPVRWLCAREILITHLQSLGFGETKRFTEVSDKRFADWMDIRKPMFMMAHDGDDIAVDEDEGNDWVDGGDEVMEYEMKLMIQRLMQLGERMNVALINRVEFVDSKVSVRIILMSTDSC